MQYTILPSSKSRGIGAGLTYESAEQLQPGQYVRIPLRQKIVDGLVLDCMEAREKQEFQCKEIHEILGDSPLLFPHQIRTLVWMAQEYCCSIRQALGAFLPGSQWKELLPKEEVWYSLQECEGSKGSEECEERKKVKGIKQKLVIEILKDGKKMKIEELRQESGASTATIRGLVDRGMLVEEVKREGDEKTSNPKPQISRPSLTEDQQVAYESIKTDPRPSLLFGVTGSGKTEIYAQLIADCIEDGKQAILLVPEILLTEHCIHRFEDLLGKESISVMHSRLTPSQRRMEWRRIHQGNVQLVIGSRSALFTPMENLGLVIIDEEHEWTYKNEQTPRYHAREVAEKLCEETRAKLVLGSATPSLESWSRSMKLQTSNLKPQKEYHMATLPNRYKNQALPNVQVVDLASVNFGSLYPFSPNLLEAIDDRLQKGEQSILFLNRRGLATALLCLECRRRIVSPDSQLPFTLHRMSARECLVDHTTGLTIDVPSTCPACGSANLHAVGAGTQKVEDLLYRQFPQARILRADRDTLDHPEKMRLLLKKMRENQADILLGTQSVVKGLDLPNVTLAAVLLADVGLSLPHFRAGERTFQLLTQLTGRSGRAKPGDVIIQTYRPDAPEVKLAAEHAVEQYLNQELKLRMHTQYPPHGRMVRFLFRGPGSSQSAAILNKEIEAIGSKKEIVSVSAAPTLFGGGNVWHVLVRCNDPHALCEYLELDGVIVDVDPMECV